MIQPDVRRSTNVKMYTKNSSTYKKKEEKARRDSLINYPLYTNFSTGVPSNQHLVFIFY